MIDLENNRLVRGNTEEPIERWETWFKTPFGYAENYEQGLKVAKTLEVDPNMCLIPVPVAISKTTHEVWER